MKTLQERVREYLYENNLDQDDLAHAARVSASSVSRMMNHPDGVGPYVRGRIAQALDDAGIVEPDPIESGPADESPRRVTLGMWANHARAIRDLRTDLNCQNTKIEALTTVDGIRDKRIDDLRRIVRVNYEEHHRISSEDYARLRREAYARLNRAMIAGTLMWAGLLAWVVFMR